MAAFQIIAAPDFERQAKKLNKRYRSWVIGYAELLHSLSQNPVQGSSLGKDCYKVRLAIASKNKGKRGGARIITCVKVVGERVYLLTVFDKSDRENLAPGELDVLLAEAGLG